MYFTFDHPDKFLPEVTEALAAFENRLIEDHELVEETSDALFDSGHDKFSWATCFSHLVFPDPLNGNYSASKRNLFDHCSVLVVRPSKLGLLLYVTETNNAQRRIGRYR